MKRRNRLAAAVVAAAAASLPLAGCVNLPTSGEVRVNSLPNSGLPLSNQVQMIPSPPGAGWDAQDIVGGFLAASGSDLTVAKEYLTGPYEKVWHPSSQPDVIDTAYHSTPPVPISSHLTGGQPTSKVTVTSQHLETLVAAGNNEAGRLQVSSAPAPYNFNFSLTRIGGEWRISGISNFNGRASKTILLMTNSDFLRDYQPRNLYFLANRSSDALVPYPVYIADSTRLLGVPQLAAALQVLPPPNANWLFKAVTTAFPSGTTIAAQVHANQAVIYLGGSAARADFETLQQMKAQLFWTLTNSPYSGGTGIGSVDLHVGDKSFLLAPPQFSGWIPRSGNQPLYYQALNRAGYPVLETFKANSGYGTGPGGFGHHRLVPSTVPLPAGVGRGRLSAIAISPEQTERNFTTKFAGCRGRSLYVYPLIVGSRLLSQQLPGNCTSLSWDDHENLWVTAGHEVYVVTQTPIALDVMPVTIPAFPDPDSATFTSLKVAPDGLRVAMIVRAKTGSGVYVGAVEQKGSLVYLGESSQLLTLGPDLADPVALSWLDADHLLVLDRRPTTELRAVPLDGGQSVPVPATPPGATSVSASGSVVAVATTGPDGRGEPGVQISRDLGELWQPVARGSTPVYPG